MQSPLTRERERIIAVFFYGVVLLLGYLFLQILAPFFASLGWAVVLAIFVYPWHAKLSRRYGNARAAALSTLIVSLFIVGPGLVLLTWFAQESQAAVLAVDRDVFAGQVALLERAWDVLRGSIPGAQAVDLRTLIDDVISRIGGFVAARVGGLVADIAVLLFRLFVTLFALFFFLRDADTIMYEVRRSLPFEDLRRERMIRQTRDLVYASIAVGLVIASLQGLAGGLVFAALGLTAPVFWGVMMGFLALLPFVGTWVVWLPAAIWLLATEQFVKGIVLVVVGVAVVGSIDNIVRPAILSGRAQMNGLLMFISLLGGISAFGLLGLVLGPLITAIVIALFEAYTGPAEIIGVSAADTAANQRAANRNAP
ncbi:MAG TPA: AI-2E family transporter [Vicinamibacterales bacterium]|nr:AI-2E family transporter [Vicinamibacterales bacterium]